MSTFWEPPPLLAIGAVVGSVLLAYAVGFATAPAPSASIDSSGSDDHSAGIPRDDASSPDPGEPTIHYAETQPIEAEADPSPESLDPRSATKP